MDKNKTHMTDELLPIKRSRKKLKIGDVFVIQPKESLYFYGKVIEVNDKFQGFSVDAVVIFIYKKNTAKLEMPDYLDPNDLLIPPQIVNLRGWTMGYFYTVGNMELTNDEMNLDYGFKDTRKVKPRFLTSMGEELDHEPSIVGIYAIGSYGSTSYEVTKELEEHPELLDV
jgi:hypothetical protein